MSSPMGLFGAKHVTCPANEWTFVIDNAFVQLPVTFEVQLRTTSGAPVAGTYVEKASRWIFPGEPRQGPLTDRLRFERGWFNTFYSVRICPTEACVAEVK